MFPREALTCINVDIEAEVATIVFGELPWVKEEQNKIDNDTWGLGAVPMFRIPPSYDTNSSTFRTDTHGAR